MEKKKIEEEKEKKGKKKWLLLLLLLLLFVFVSIGVTYSVNEEFKDSIDETIINAFKVDTPTAPMIEGSSKEWSRKEIVKVVKDAKSYSGIGYYEYCMVDSKDFSNCEWKKTETKNMVASTTGKYYVVFRGISKNGKTGKNSNIEEVLIDNEGPTVSKLEITNLKSNKVEVYIEAKDNHSGIGSYYYKIDNGEYQKVEKTFNIDALEEKEYTITIKVEDKLGNYKEVSKVFTYKQETTSEDEPSKTPGETPSTSPEPTNTPSNTPSETPKPTSSPDVTPEPTTTPTPTPTEEPTPGEEDIIPEINLDKVPLEFTYGEKYDLPSYVDFKGETGSVSCIVEGKEYTNTSTLKIGKHLIVCNATTSKNIRVMVEKSVEVKVGVGEEEVWDGWIRLNLYYPENSTNWQWRLGSEEEIRTGYKDDGWQDYTGPILVKLSDVENIYIRYDLNKETVIVAPKGKVLVDIEPSKYSLKGEEKTKVKITYDKDAEITEYRIGGGDWQEYKGEFEVGKNTLIEARATKNEKVYNSDGEYQYTSKKTGTDSVFISEVIESGSSSGTGTTGGGPGGSIIYEPTPGPGGIVITTPEPGSQPSTYLVGPIISSSPNEEIVEEAEVSIQTQEVADKIYYSINYGAYQEYTNSFKVNDNCLIRAYYIRYSDGKRSEVSYYYVENIKSKDLPYVRIDATPSTYLSEDVESVEVGISGNNYDTLEYSLDGVIYQEYTSTFRITRSSTVYARGKNQYGEKIASKTITTITSPEPQEELDVSIYVSPDKNEVEGLINKVKVSIDYDSKAEKKYYKLGYYGEWVEYTGDFELTTNTTIYAYCTSSNGGGESKKQVSYLTTGISDPIIKADTITKQPQVKVSIEYNKNAEIMRYQVGNGPMLDYNGAFYVYENTTITAYNRDVLGNEAESKIQINNIVPTPNYLVIEKGKYFIIKLNYPEISSKTSREYKWKPNGEWKEYDEKGILLIKPDYKDEFDLESAAGIKVEDGDGKEVIFTDHYYLIDVAFSELMENLFMRWDTAKPTAPSIILSTEEPTKKVEVGIIYPSILEKKYYKVVSPDGSDTGWKEYTGKIEIDKNNTTIYAKGITRNEVVSEVGSKKIVNIDEIDPEIKVVGDLESPKKQVTLKVEASDNLEIDKVKWAALEKDKSYFKESGETIPNNGTFTVNENGKYTVYAKDLVGNEVVKVIEVTNIDKTAPDIIINVLTESYGIEAEVSIDYSDSKTKEYSIGNNTSYQSYTGNIKIKANDVLNLVNEDGSLTIYARGTDEAGNGTEVSEKIYVLDLDAPKSPIIHAGAGYPVLTEYGVKLGSDSYIVYDQTRDDIDNYYSIDNGTTWEVYKGPFEITSGTIMAKSVKKESGLTVSASKKIDMPTDALGPEAYDGDENTKVYIFNTIKKIKVSSEMQNKQMYLTAALGSYSNWYTLYIKFIDNNDEVISQIATNGKTYTKEAIDIPDKTVEVQFHSVGGDKSINVFEISQNDVPKIDESKYYPILTEYGVESGYNEVTIDYFKTSVERLYRINGEEWKEYFDKAIKLEIGDVIEAKSIDKYGRETAISTYTATLPDDALGLESYDGDESTYVGGTNKIYILKISKEMQENRFALTATITSYDKRYPCYIYFINENNEVIDSIGSGWRTFAKENILIPIGTDMIRLSSIGSDRVFNIYEIVSSTVPTITQTNNYPTLSSNDFTDTKYQVKINYLSYLTNKQYSIDGGNTWLDYTKPFEVSPGTVVQAKAVDKDGNDTEISTYTVTALTDAIDSKTFDNNQETIYTLTKNTSKSFTVTNDTIGRKLRIYLTNTPATNSSIKVYDKSNKELGTYSLTSQVTVLELPGNSYKVTVSAGSSALNISEINLRPVIEKTNIQNPIITISDVNWNTSKGIEITYPEGYTNEYSLDLGNTWNTYTTEFTITEATTILARSVDSDGKVVSSSSYKVTKVDSVEPSIQLDIPDRIPVGTEYSLPTSYTVGISGGEPTCKIGEDIVINTKDLEIGTYQVECSITNGLNLTATTNKTIEIYQDTLNSLILKNNPLIEAEPTLTTSSNNTSDASGLYKSTATNSGEPTYYFRGNVENNYVSFAGFTWRIVRINEDGTVRLIMQDGINNNATYALNNNWADSASIYYKNSAIKIEIDNWYQDKLINYQDKLASEYYCGESHANWNMGPDEGALYTDYVPTFKCEATDFNHLLNIGLLTYDEVVFSGGYWDLENDSYYLASGSSSWTMSPAGYIGGMAYSWGFKSSRSVYPTTTNENISLRPVINLKTNQKITGNGTSTNPYVIE